MCNSSDVFGNAILSWLDNKNEDLLFIERDDGLISKDSVSHYFYKGENEFKGYQKGLLGYITDPILDLGCGPGRFTNYLIEKGHNVVGADTSLGALHACKLNSKGNNKLVQMSLQDMGFVKNYFRTVLIMGHTIGAAGNYINLANLFQVLSNISTEDSKILLTSVDVMKLADEEERKYFLDKQKLTNEIGKQKMRLRFKEQIGPWLDWIFVPPNILQDLAEKNMWSVIDFLYDENRPDRYAAVLKKHE